jgi:hypothetical protein
MEDGETTEDDRDKKIPETPPRQPDDDTAMAVAETVTDERTECAICHGPPGCKSKQCKCCEACDILICYEELE